nr:bifunctional UDP-sugar hydrolase/5'-nucleotidase [Kofleriaceae bacterium]
MDRPQPNLKGQDIRFTVIHTADIHSRLFPYNFVPNKFDQGFDLLPANAPFGGIARIATLVKQFRAQTDRSLWLDSGDAWQGAPVFNEFKGEPEIRSLSLAGMEAEVLGNHEFDTGAANLYQKIANWSQFPHLVANYAWDDYGDKTEPSLRDVTQPYEIFDVNGLKVGVIGMGNTDTLLSSYQGGNNLGFRALTPGVLSQYVAVLRPVCDLVVVVSHLGLDEDEGVSAAEVDDLNAQLPNAGVDLILGGHLHIVTNPPKLLAHTDPSDPDSPTYTGSGGQTEYCQHNNCQTLLVHSGAFAKYVGKLDLVVHVGDDNADPNKRSRIASYAYNNFPVDSRTPDDPEVAGLLWPYSVKLNQDIDLNGTFAWVSGTGEAGTEGILRNDTSNGDSQLGNMVARSMMVQQGVYAQFALTNSLGIRDNFYPGRLDNEQMYNVFPFENSIVVIYLSGQEIQDTLDFVAQRSAGRGCRTQVQVAGITFDMVCQGDPALDCGNRIDPATNKPATACAKNIYLGDACRSDKSDPTHKIDPNADIDPDKTPCAPLEINGLYRAAVNDYIAAGGSGFLVLARNTSAQNTGVSLRVALTVFLTNQQHACDGTSINDIQLDPNCVAGNGKTCPSVKQTFGNISCLDETIEPHDGRIRPVFSSVGNQ